MKINKNFFKFGFIILTSFIVLNCIFGLTIFVLDNPLNFSWHPDFFIGLLFGTTYFGTIYFGWLKKIE